MAEFFPSGAVTGEASAAAAAAAKGGLFSGPAKPSADDSDAARSSGSAQLQAAPGAVPRPTTLAAVPEHQPIPEKGPSSSGMALARSDAPIPTSVSAAPILARPSGGPSHKGMLGPVQSTGHLPEAPNPSPHHSHSGSIGPSTSGPSSDCTATGSSSTGSYRSPSASASAAVGVSGMRSSSNQLSGAAGDPSRSGTSGTAVKVQGSVGGSGGGRYPPEVLEAAKPYLTGDPVADEDILGFYMARHSMIHGGG